MSETAWFADGLRGRHVLLELVAALRSGQFKDLEGAAYRALEDDPPDP